ncbi:Primosomal protein N' [Candidatus Hepatincola sp. Pdp]
MYKEGDIVSVCLPLKLSKFYAYTVPKDCNVNKGDIVLVPLRNQQVYGIIFKQETKINFEVAKLKHIIKKIEQIPSLNSQLIDFLAWVAKYNLSSFGKVLKMAINVAGFNFNHYDEIISINTNKIQQLKITPKRQKLLTTLQELGALEKNTLIAKAAISRSIVNQLIKEGYLQVTNNFKQPVLEQNICYEPIALSDNQQEVTSQLLQVIDSRKFQTVVLQGLPGSGKTEVYFEAINRVLNLGKQVLILLPEIALSAQIFQRFQKRFKVKPYLWHSDISKKNKQEAWISASNGSLKIIIGARSALFLPFANLGLIVVDEEHDNSYKQEEGVIYNARDMAVVKAKVENIPIILSSATPALETMNNVSLQKYKHLLLQERYNKSIFPVITQVDLKQEKLTKGEYISQVLHTKITNTLNKQEQVLLFINKRGYAGTILCTSCLEKITCKYCSATLVEHKSHNKLYCHYCGYATNVTSSCPNCGEEKLVALGVGVEKIFEEVTTKFPKAKVVIASSDTMQSYKKSQELIQQIHNHEYDIIIGTQIISKGYNFPKLTLVGILDADFISSVDLKATERAWQLLYQVAGRAGRYNLLGEVVLQTYNPKSEFMQSFLQKDYNVFVNNELSLRKSLSFPPFGKFIALIVSSKNAKLLEQFVNYLAKIQPKGLNLEILGPSQAPMFLLRNFYRYRFLVQARNQELSLQNIVKKWLLKVKIPSTIKVQIDVDPISFF